MTRVTIDRVRSALLTLAAVLGVTCILSVAAGLLLDIRPLVVKSGSMSPTIETGALAWTRQVPASDLSVGDVVMVENAEGNRVTHRIVSLEDHGASAVLELQGDANPVPDVERYPVSDAYRVFADVPYGGRVVAWLSGPYGLFLLGMYAMALLVVVLRRRDGDEPPRTGRRAGRKVRRRGRKAALAAAPLATLLVAGTAAPSSALFSDSAGVGTPSISTHTVPTTNLACGALGILSVTFTWTAVPGATSYTLHYGAGGSSTTTTAATSETIVTAIAGGRAWVTVNRNFGSTTWTSAPSNTRSYTVAVVSLCS